MLREAPLFADVADGPEGGRAFWLTASDGVQLRAGVWLHSTPEPSGTVLMFPGRTEYVEKYGRVAKHLTAAGYSTLVMDWRGQGLADRLHADPQAGHVERFTDYQLDVAEAVKLARAEGLPEPYMLIGHSMGGCIGLRAAMEGLPVTACAFTGPMWGIYLSAPLRPAAWVISWGSGKIGLGHTFAPSTKREALVVAEPFEGNTLTTSPEMFHHMQRQIGRYPQLALGGPSLTWLHEALRECRTLMRRPAPDLPCVAFVGSNERIVDVPRIEQRMAAWPGAQLHYAQDAEHEVLMERAAVRTEILDTIVVHFDAARQAQPTARNIASQG
ncbi:alpha/beta fold hydrolase [Pseudaestuariivita sp.]|uniref:alpha/beta fold hydrolase n=1 Tax=Pseudaestuariivita sp. TaxID=2211669 RepID=UPI0040586206